MYTINNWFCMCSTKFLYRFCTGTYTLLYIKHVRTVQVYTDLCEGPGAGPPHQPVLAPGQRRHHVVVGDVRRGVAGLVDQETPAFREGEGRGVSLHKSGDGR